MFVWRVDRVGWRIELVRAVHVRGHFFVTKGKTIQLTQSVVMSVARAIARSSSSSFDFATRWTLTAASAAAVLSVLSHYNALAQLQCIRASGVEVGENSRSLCLSYSAWIGETQQPTFFVYTHTHTDSQWTLASSNSANVIVEQTPLTLTGKWPRRRTHYPLFSSRTSASEFIRYANVCFYRRQHRRRFSLRVNPVNFSAGTNSRFHE